MHSTQHWIALLCIHSPLLTNTWITSPLWINSIRKIGQDGMMWAGETHWPFFFSYREGWMFTVGLSFFSRSGQSWKIINRIGKFWILNLFNIYTSLPIYLCTSYINGLLSSAVIGRTLQTHISLKVKAIFSFVSLWPMRPTLNNCPLCCYTRT